MPGLARGNFLSGMPEGEDARRLAGPRRGTLPGETSCPARPKGKEVRQAAGLRRETLPGDASCPADPKGKAARRAAGLRRGNSPGDTSCPADPKGKEARRGAGLRRGTLPGETSCPACPKGSEGRRLVTPLYMKKNLTPAWSMNIIVWRANQGRLCFGTQNTCLSSDGSTYSAAEATRDHGHSSGGETECQHLIS